MPNRRRREKIRRTGPEARRGHGNDRRTAEEFATMARTVDELAADWDSDPVKKLSELKDMAKVRRKRLKAPSVLRDAFSRAGDSIIEGLRTRPHLANLPMVNWRLGVMLSYIGRDSDAMKYVKETLRLTDAGSELHDKATHKKGLIQRALSGRGQPAPAQG